jgi:transposase-like protein
MAITVKCPKCKSVSVLPFSQDKKHLLLKTVVGGAAFGPVGVAVGFMNGKKEVTFGCTDCGRVFTEKI